MRSDALIYCVTLVLSILSYQVSARRRPDALRGADGLVMDVCVCVCMSCASDPTPALLQHDLDVTQRTGRFCALCALWDARAGAWLLLLLLQRLLLLLLLPQLLFLQQQLLLPTHAVAVCLHNENYNSLVLNVGMVAGGRY